ncbi:MAG: NUDIX hydrolase [Rhodobacteraceae bacterium]|nr:NUDIX hydrolase [Paracoccaceae bacterium]
MRRFDEARRYGIRYRQRPGAYGILRRGDKLLITFQARPEPEFQLPGGGIDPGESPLIALHREVREETGWGIAIERRLGAFQRYAYMPDYDIWARKVCHIYLCRPTFRKGPISEPDHSAHWVSLTTAAHILGNEGDRHFVAALL